MARRVGKSASRLDLRRAAEAAELLGASDSGSAKKKAVKKKAATRRKTKKKTVSEKMRMVWGVFDNGNQQIATFPYSDREEADKKAEEMNAKGRGIYFVQPVKEPYDEDLDE